MHFTPRRLDWGWCHTKSAWQSPEFLGDTNKNNCCYCCFVSVKGWQIIRVNRREILIAHKHVSSIYETLFCISVWGKRNFSAES
jgi:hypothetical protein